MPSFVLSGNFLTKNNDQKRLSMCGQNFRFFNQKFRQNTFLPKQIVIFDQNIFWRRHF